MTPEERERLESELAIARLQAQFGTTAEVRREAIERILLIKLELKQSTNEQAHG